MRVYVCVFGVIVYGEFLNVSWNVLITIIILLTKYCFICNIRRKEYLNSAKCST